MRDLEDVLKIGAEAIYFSSVVDDSELLGVDSLDVADQLQLLGLLNHLHIVNQGEKDFVDVDSVEHSFVIEHRGISPVDKVM